MSAWILFTLAAAAMQTVRFMLQKQLKGAGLSTGGATFSRFLYAAPIAATAAAAALWQAGWALPPLGLDFAGFVLMGALGQIVATFLTVSLFSLRNFAVGIAFTKTETVQVAAFSVLLLGERVGAVGWIAIGIGLAGVLLLSRTPEPCARFFGRAALYGLLAGGLFGLSAIGYRGATLALEPLPFLTRAVVALAAATSMACGLPFLIVRNRKKDYGTSKDFEGALEKGDGILLVEDIATTGGQVLEAAKTLTEAGASVEKIVAVVDRMEGARENIEGAGFAFDALLNARDLRLPGVS